MKETNVLTDLDRPCAFVPTMGALHAGHQSLIRRAREFCDEVVVSVFVNPLQFEDKDDLAKYPKTPEIDAELASDAGATVLWRPDYVGTNTFEEIPEDDPRYNNKAKFLNFEWVPTGQRGKFIHHPITKYVEIYPAEWELEWENWPRLRLHFKRGIIQDYEDITGQR